MLILVLIVIVIISTHAINHNEASGRRSSPWASRRGSWSPLCPVVLCTMPLLQQLQQYYGHFSCQDPTNQDPLSLTYENTALRN